MNAVINQDNTQTYMEKRIRYLDKKLAGLMTQYNQAEDQSNSYEVLGNITSVLFSLNIHRQKLIDQFKNK
jgi:hypothetical protein